ncbi:MAG: redox-sensing transcriptional repressor Rex [SAR202 cluster bacterium]|nr:redox-sensing transcriptional repressor Rex [SAR202 cluster bacterium]|tara:strand:+ start:13972 stop:14595 length:624 start_codon:yes stop_codon:yes gene_type:complete
MAKDSFVPEVVILRLPLYIRALTQMSTEGQTVISSKSLGDRLQITPAQIRKDLSYFGRFGKQGRGYKIESLVAELTNILGLNRQWNSCIVGVGRLGKAIINYPGFVPEGFKIIYAFDNDQSKVGQTVNEIKILPMNEIKAIVKDNNIKIAILAVPATIAQNVISDLVETNIKAILNYAPIAPKVPNGLIVRNIDPVLSLQSMTYYLD